MKNSFSVLFILQQTFSKLILTVILVLSIGLVRAQSIEDCFEFPIEQESLPSKACYTFGSLPVNRAINGPITSLSLGVAGLTNEVVYINGEFQINSNFFFQNCKVKMGPGAKIRTTNGKNLTVTDSYLFACSQMWAGIEVNENSYCGLFNSNFEDAQYALSAVSTAKIDLVGNTFNRNWVGVRALTGTTMNPLMLLSFKKNTFTYTGPSLLPSFTGQAPIPQGNRSFIGMWLEGQGAIVLSPTAEIEINLFSKLNIGILCQSPLTVNKSCRFEGIKKEGTNGVLNQYSTGNGILVPTSILVHFTGFNDIAGANPSFLNCSTGIKLEKGGKVGVDNTLFTGNIRGIHGSSDGFFYVCEVSHSRFNMSSLNAHGILLQSNISTLAFSVDESEFYLNGIGINYGVEISGVATIPTFIQVHENNKFFMSGTKIGVKMDNIQSDAPDKVIIEDNIFTMTELQGSSPTAIQMTTCVNARIQSNLMLTNYIIDNTASKGISLKESNFICIRQNNFEGKVSPALKIEGTCSFIAINCNTFCSGGHNSSTQTSVFVDASGLIEPQKHKGNKFFGHTTGLNNSPSFDQMKFIVDIGADPAFIPSIAPVPSGWFIDANDNGISLPCGSNCGTVLNNPSYCYIVRPPSFDESIADGSLFTLNPDPVLAWNARRMLYKYLQDNPSLNVPNSVFETFYYGQSAAAVGAFHQVQQAILGLISIPAADQVTLLALYAQLKSKMAALAALDGQLDLLADPSSNPSLLNNMEAVSSQITVIEGQIASMNDQLSTSRIAGAAAVASMNNALTTNTNFQLYEKQVNEILLAWIASGYAELSAAQLDTLESIASLCPNVAGRAVYRATFMLPFCKQREVEAAREVTCNGSNLLPNSNAALLQTPSNQLGGLSIYPNPTNQSLSIRLPHQDYDHCQVLLINIYGQTVQMVQAEAGQGELSMSVGKIPTGLYSCTVLMDGANVHTSVISISH